MRSTLIALLLAGLGGCEPTDGCIAQSTRCNGELVEVCDAEARWQTVMDCTQVAEQSGGTWACVELADEGATCLPQEPDAQ